MVTVDRTWTSLIFHAVMTPKLEPHPPLMAQNRSFPIVLLFSIVSLTLIICASITLSAARPYFLKMVAKSISTQVSSNANCSATPSREAMNLVSIRNCVVEFSQSST
ncbi:hypothetical protein HN51_056752 [Arachis hypogaea]